MVALVEKAYHPFHLRRIDDLNGLAVTVYNDLRPTNLCGSNYTTWFIPDPRFPHMSNEGLPGSIAVFYKGNYYLLEQLN